MRRFDSTSSRRMHAAWEVLASREIYSAKPWVTLSRQQIRLPNGKIVNDYHNVEMPEYTVIFAETADGKIVVERQYKHGVAKVSLTLPAGLVEKGEDTLKAAQRELLEETGYTASGWRHLGSFVPNSNYSCGKAHLYHARGAHRIAEPNAGDLEEIEILFLTPAELLEAVRTGQVHAMSMAAAIAMATNPGLSNGHGFLRNS